MLSYGERIAKPREYIIGLFNAILVFLCFTLLIPEIKRFPMAVDITVGIALGILFYLASVRSVKSAKLVLVIGLSLSSVVLIVIISPAELEHPFTSSLSVLGFISVGVTFIAMIFHKILSKIEHATVSRIFVSFLVGSGGSIVLSIPFLIISIFEGKLDDDITGPLIIGFFLFPVIYFISTRNKFKVNIVVCQNCGKENKTLLRADKDFQCKHCYNNAYNPLDSISEKLGFKKTFKALLFSTIIAYFVTTIVLSVVSFLAPMPSIDYLDFWLVMCAYNAGFVIYIGLPFTWVTLLIASFVRVKPLIKRARLIATIQSCCLSSTTALVYYFLFDQ